MKSFMLAGIAFSAVFIGSGHARAATNYPWCIISNNRGMDCVFSSHEQCEADGRNRGFGSNCRPNPDYKRDCPPS